MVKTHVETCGNQWFLLWSPKTWQRRGIRRSQRLLQRLQRTPRAAAAAGAAQAPGTAGRGNFLPSPCLKREIYMISCFSCFFLGVRRSQHFTRLHSMMLHWFLLIFILPVIATAQRPNVAAPPGEEQRLRNDSPADDAGAAGCHQSAAATWTGIAGGAWVRHVAPGCFFFGGEGRREHKLLLVTSFDRSLSYLFNEIIPVNIPCWPPFLKTVQLT